MGKKKKSKPKVLEQERSRYPLSLLARLVSLSTARPSLHPNHPLIALVKPSQHNLHVCTLPVVQHVTTFCGNRLLWPALLPYGKLSVCRVRTGMALGGQACMMEVITGGNPLEHAYCEIG